MKTPTSFRFAPDIIEALRRLAAVESRSMNNTIEALIVERALKAGIVKFERAPYARDVRMKLVDKQLGS